MNVFTAILEYIAPSVPSNVQELSMGMCVIPAKTQRKEEPRRKESDMYVIDEERHEFGFHTATAVNHNEGGVRHLTGYDKALLKERSYWGGKTVEAKNEQAKAHWHSGKTEKEAAALLAVSLSWVEKRFGTFSTALLQEGAEKQ